MNLLYLLQIFFKISHFSQTNVIHNRTWAVNIVALQLKNSDTSLYMIHCPIQCCTFIFFANLNLYHRPVWNDFFSWNFSILFSKTDVQTNTLIFILWWTMDAKYIEMLTFVKGGSAKMCFLYIVFLILEWGQ